MLKILLSCLVPFFLVNLCKSQLPQIGRCPAVKTVDPFLAERYLGVWYEVEKYPFIFEIGGKCITANYALREDGNISVTNRLINRVTGRENVIEGRARIVGPGKLGVTFPSTFTNFEAPYWILDTDYVTYAVVFSCSDIGFINVRMVWILTREPNPSPNVLNKAYKVLDKYQISRAYLTQTEHMNCSY